MRGKQLKILVLGVLLAAFFGAGAILIAQDTVANARTEPESFAVYFYQNPFAVERQGVSEKQSKLVESGSLSGALLLWCVGLPLATVAGLAVGLMVRRPRQILQAQGRHPVQYMPFDSSRLDPAVSKKRVTATRQDISGRPAEHCVTAVPSCRTRFRPAAFSAKR